MKQNLKPGDILLFKAEKGISKLIAWGTNSPYSHVAVCVSPPMNLAIEAMAFKGIRSIDIRTLDPTHYDVFRIQEQYEYDINKSVSYLVSKLNSKYDYLGVAYLGLLKLLAKIGFSPFLRNTANRWQKNRDYFCSELCYEAFFAGGLDIVPHISEADITAPGDIAHSPVTQIITADNHNVSLIPQKEQIPKK